MNKIIKNMLCISIISILFSLLACEAESENSETPLNKSETNVTDTTFEWEGEYEKPDYSIYKKSAAENKMDYSKIYINGEVLDTNIIPKKDDELYAAKVKDNEGNEWGFGYKEDGLLVKGESYTFFGIYLGIATEFDDLPTIQGTRLIYENESVPVVYDGFEIHEVYEGYSTEELQEQNRTRSSFFDEEERREQFDELNSKYDYKKLEKFVKEYLDTEDPHDEDSAYDIYEIIQEIMPYVNNVEVTYDDIEDTMSVYYEGLNKIDENNHIVPMIEGGSEGLYVGFINSNWLFFDKTYIKLANDEVVNSSYKKSSIESEVLGGGTILEYHRGFKNLEEFVDSEPLTIRFKNTENDKHLEFDVSKKEQKAFEAIHKLRNANRELSDMKYRWEEENL